MDSPERAPEVVDIDLTPGAERIVISGEDVTDRIVALDLHACADDLPHLTVEYHCQAVRINGEARIHHLCPVNDRGGASHEDLEDIDHAFRDES